MKRIGQAGSKAEERRCEKGLQNILKKESVKRLKSDKTLAKSWKGFFGSKSNKKIKKWILN